MFSLLNNYLTIFRNNLHKIAFFLRFNLFYLKLTKLLLSEHYLISYSILPNLIKIVINSSINHNCRKISSIKNLLNLRKKGNLINYSYKTIFKQFSNLHYNSEATLFLTTSSGICSHHDLLKYRKTGKLLFLIE